MTRVVMIIEGGVLLEVFTDPGVKCVVLDYDNMKEEGRNELELEAVREMATKDLDWAPVEDHTDYVEELAKELKEEERS